MSLHRPYPDERAGPFLPPPTEFVARSGAEIVIERLPTDRGDDVERLVEMYETFDAADRAQGIPPIRREEIRDWLELVLADGPDVIASHDDEPVGHATLVPDGEAEYELAIFVHQDYRRRGIGSSLLRSLLGAAEADGIEYVWLSVERWNSVAIRLYEAVGFRSCEGGRFERVMSLRLAGSDG